MKKTPAEFSTYFYHIFHLTAQLIKNSYFYRCYSYPIEAIAYHSTLILRIKHV